MQTKKHTIKDGLKEVKRKDECTLMNERKAAPAESSLSALIPTHE